MWFLKREQRILTGLGVLAVAALLLLWQPPKRFILLPEVLVASASVWESRLAAARRVDLNSASALELTRLPGVGPTLAQRIVQYRDAHGRFGSLEDLAQVRGIGPKTLHTLRDYVTP